MRYANKLKSAKSLHCTLNTPSVNICQLPAYFQLLFRQSDIKFTLNIFWSASLYYATKFIIYAVVWDHDRVIEL